MYHFAFDGRRYSVLSTEIAYSAKAIVLPTGVIVGMVWDESSPPQLTNVVVIPESSIDVDEAPSLPRAVEEGPAQ
jgi:hypothetical protein